MTDDGRKLLTKVMGECWHSLKSSHYYSFPDRCLSCGNLITSLSRRTFDTFRDAGELAVRLVELGLWEKVEDYLYHRWLADKSYPGLYTSWHMTDPARFCQLTADCPAVKEWAGEGE